MKYCREMFLKCPPPESAVIVTESQLLDKDSKSIDDEGTRKKGKKKSRRRQKLPKHDSLDDSLNWVTDCEESSDDSPSTSSRRRRNNLRAEQDQIQLIIMREIYQAQSQDVKDVINDLYRLHLRQQRAAMRKMSRPRLLLAKKPKKNNLKPKIIARKLGAGETNATNVGFVTNVKILARLQRRRRNRGKPRSKRNCHKKFPRRRRRRNAKKGNRQGRKRCLRAQRLFDKGIFLAGRKLLDEVWQAVKDPDATATTFCNNNIHGLSKIHKKQIELYERIEEDLHRLDAARQERAEAALERKAKEQEKEAAIHEGFKNKIEARAAARVEQDSLRKQRRAARKQRALEKKTQKEKTKFEEYLKPVAVE
ncbi:uncharacterized protein LOC129920048 [Episyrphus balteatus]|uniref:uncharacterized protein LOC129920048 n=1 Tax=Episyrphus balteatus TaxID=286459 RepID=UPI0024850702|nr:uncharacterized protein LOC129920048 [Episyrphus balteatus]